MCTDFSGNEWYKFYLQIIGFPSGQCPCVDTFDFHFLKNFQTQKLTSIARSIQNYNSGKNRDFRLTGEAFKSFLIVLIKSSWRAIDRSSIAGCMTWIAVLHQTWERKLMESTGTWGDFIFISESMKFWHPR